MKSNIYMMLNDIDSEADAFQEEEWSELETKRVKKKVLGRVRRKGKKKYVMAGVCAAAAFALLTIMPLRGAVADAVEQLSYRIGAFLGIDKNLAPYEQIVNQSVTEDGITNTLNSVVLDVDELVVSTTEVYENAITEGGPGLMGNVYINGVRASGAAGGGSYTTDEHTREVVMKYYLNQVDLAELSQEVNVAIRFSDYEENRGSWEFKFTASGEQLSADTQTIDLTYQYQLPDGCNITFTKYTSNAMGQKIFYTNDGNKNDYDMKLEGTDNLGNPVSFYVSSSNKEGGRFVIDNSGGNLSDEAETLTLTPYAVKYPETSGRLSNDFEQVGEAFTIEVR